MIRELFEEKPQLKKILLYILLGLVGLIIIIVILTQTLGGKITYSNLENKMREAAISYYESNSNLLPSENNSVELEYSKLEDAKLLKSINKYLKTKNCSAKVIVKNTGGHYTYSPSIDCGENYKTKLLYDQIISDNEQAKDNAFLETASDGSKVFRGEVTNNYVSFANKTWRIVKIDSDKTIKLIADDTTIKTSFDDRYNSEKGRNYGKNDYSMSRLKETIDNLIDGETFLTTTDKASLVSKQFCIDKKNSNDNLKTTYGVCNNFTSSQLIGLLTIDEYIYVSLDSKCTSINDRECENYNYLSDSTSSWWTLSASSEKSYTAFYVSDYGSLQEANCSTIVSIKPVIYLSENAIYESGSGTIDDPYIVK